MDFINGIDVERYSLQRKLWPQSGNSIVGNYNQDSIILYQAFCYEIAEAAVENQDFTTNNPLYSIKRTTWVKPNFLWMMFRSDWGTKKNQENILAIRVYRHWFEHVVLSAKCANTDKNCRESPVVIQWDPDHTPGGGKISLRRDIQIALKKERALEWAQGNKGPAIIEIINITNFVHSSNQARKETGDFLMPLERYYPFEARNIHLVIDKNIGNKLNPD